ncbi:uncharacterized protein LOC117606710 [Osmia lignaria lignaria]|uniref:uncharacterized protein LOC117606710 n=1 Tax=Osmia lignaria lignaria TaxID=1437193 RepID=UPI00402B3455
MEVSRENFRAMIFYDFKIGLNKIQSCARLRAAFGDSSPSTATIYRWFKEFQNGRESLLDEDRAGRPVTAVTDENVFAVKQMLEEDNRATYAQIQATLRIGSAAVRTILHDRLRTRKLCSRWVPHHLTNEQKRARVKWCQEMLQRFDNGCSNEVSNIITTDESWIYQYENDLKTEWIIPGETFPMKGRRIGKKMVCSFFCAGGHIETITLEDQSNGDAKWYTTVCLAQVFDKFRKKRLKTEDQKEIILHHNTLLHSFNETVAFLNKLGVSVLAHPPDSPDLAPSDFFLFPKVKDSVRGQRFETSETAVAAYKEFLNSIPKEEWRVEFDKWFDRMKSCIRCRGEYCEKIYCNFDSDLSPISPIPRTEIQQTSNNERRNISFEEGVKKEKIDVEEDNALPENLNDKEHQNKKTDGNKDEDENKIEVKKEQVNENEDTMIGQYEMVLVKMEENFEDEQETSKSVMPESASPRCTKVPETNGMSEIRARSLKMLQNLIQTSQKKSCNNNSQINSEATSGINDNESDQSDNDTRSYLKPPYPYHCLIAMALKNSPSGTATTTEIYDFMRRHFPYFKTTPDRWKDSITHYLWFNKNFVKCLGYEHQQKGCRWTFAPGEAAMMDEKLQKLSKEDRLAIEKAMVHPEHLDLLERGEMKYWQSTCSKNADEESSSNDDVKEESIQDRAATNSAINSVNKDSVKKESVNCTKRQRRRNMYQRGVERPNVPLLLRGSISNCCSINIE